VFWDRFDLLLNTDLPGQDLSCEPTTLNEPTLCQALCAASASTCQAWTYVNPGVIAPTAMCCLKGGVPQPKFGASCCVSGMNTGYAYRSLTFDRSHSTTESGAQLTPYFAPLYSGPSLSSTTTLHVFVDHSIVEVFVDGGRTALTGRIYPNRTDSVYIDLTSNQPSALSNSLDLWQLNGIWDN
jgi:hypothetical protein